MRFLYERDGSKRGEPLVLASALLHIPDIYSSGDVATACSGQPGKGLTRGGFDITYLSAFRPPGAVDRNPGINIICSGKLEVSEWLSRMKLAQFRSVR